VRRPSRGAGAAPEPVASAAAQAAQRHTSTSVITIERFIMEQERLHPEATGELSNLLYDLCLAAKIISRHVRRAGLTDILGASGTVNVSGDLQQKLDMFAHDTVQNAVQHTGRVCLMASEEDEHPMNVPGKPTGKYVLLFDPLDGSTNIDVNVSIGTIFSIHRRVTKTSGPGALQDCLQAGRKQVAAGYILYGSSTMLVYTTGQGVHGFTLDPTIGEFLLSHSAIHTPEVGAYYSVNESHWNHWSPGVQHVVGAFKNGDGKVRAKNARYIGSLVADFHRNLISGGIFLYPADTRSPEGKLRLLYEAAPLAFVVEQAGGEATDGCRRILDIVPTDLHQKTPLVIGSRADVGFAKEVLSADRAPTRA
jgi:fructose-1,6-bisphosphatase I